MATGTLDAKNAEDLRKSLMVAVADLAYGDGVRARMILMELVFSLPEASAPSATAQPDPRLAPEDMLASLARYDIQGIQPGSFLSAVLLNDLQDAVLRADARSMLALPHIAAAVSQLCRRSTLGRLSSSREFEARMQDCGFAPDVIGRVVGPTRKVEPIA